MLPDAAHELQPLGSCWDVVAPALQIERDLLARCSSLRGKLCVPFPWLSEILAKPLGLEALKASLIPNSLHWVGPKENSVLLLCKPDVGY